MNKIKGYGLVLLCSFFTMLASAQLKSEVIPVSGNCNMCKSTIEKASKTNGVTTAEWNKDTKMLTVQYDSKKTDAMKIQQAVANAGYDTRDVKGVSAAYEQLHNCCKYERTKTYEVKSTKSKGAGGTDCCENKDAACCKDSAGNKKTCDNKDCKGTKGCKKN